MAQKIRIGELLLEKNVITAAQLKQALDEQKRTGEKLGHILISNGAIDESVLLKLLSEQLQLPIFDLRAYNVSPEIVQLLPEMYARSYRAIVLEKNSEGLLVGMADPLDINAIDELKYVLKKPLKLVLVRESDLLRTLDLIYRRTAEISTFAGELHQELGDRSFELVLEKAQAEEAPVIKLLQSMFEDAVQVKASDIHIEPGEKILRIRLRIDGILHEQIVKEKSIASALALKLKLMAELNIAEKRLPQDGRFNIKVRDRVLDVRLSTLPTQYGESIVMRLLDQSAGILDLDEVGIPEDILKRFRSLLKSPHGIILVTGPTGSGKTTTLYAALSELNEESKNIITVEDPVEYRLPRLNQVQVNYNLGLDFVRVLRAALRQDPNIILVGEMRDQETASIAIRAALTGHLVLSTLHTNDAASSALRLIDMKTEGFLVAAALRCVLAQRLVRRICDQCKEKHELKEHEKFWLQNVRENAQVKAEFQHGKGCVFCNHTGYKGRMGIFELLELTPPMMDALRRHDAEVFSNLAKEFLAGRLLIDNALHLAEIGITTIDEAIRIAGEV
ncbi:MAG: MSHA biogenesis protein MshE [Gammaproteobacteria bacterium GWE2_42_36]|nr:MAG: MSHA biogenesis protein MshE [Gammaproteobacteria bacterium GWE2_42_36]